MASPVLSRGNDVAVDRGGRVQVVARDHHRAADVADAATSVPSGTMSPLSLRTLSWLMSLDRLRKLPVGLEVDLPVAAEVVEVVDVVASPGRSAAR